MGLAVLGSVVCLVVVVGFDVVVVVDLVLSVLGLGVVDGLVVVAVVGLIVGLVVVELIVVALVVVVFVVGSDVGTGVGLFVVIGFPVGILGVTAQSTFTL